MSKNCPTDVKECRCYTCGKDLHYLGVASHRAMHRRRRERCRIGYTDGDIKTHDYRESG